MVVRIEVDGLRIEPLAAPDVPAFAAYRRMPDVARWQSWGEDFSDAAAILIVTTQPEGLPGDDEWLQLAVRDAAVPGSLLGDVAVHRVADQPDTFELGVTLAPASQGRGVGTRAVRAVAEHLFRTAGAHRLIAFSDARNTAVAALLERVGFRHEGRAVEADWFKQEWTTVDAWAVLAREWDAGAADGGAGGAAGEAR